MDDVSTLCALGRRMREESAVPFPEVDEQVTRDTWAALGDGYFVALAEQDGKAVGFLTAQLSRYISSPTPFVQHDILYVAPEARGSMAFFRLVKAYEAWAKKIGVRRCCISVTTGLSTEVTGRAYEKLGYRYMGGNFMREL